MCEGFQVFTASRLSEANPISRKDMYGKMLNSEMLGWGSSDNGRLGYPDGKENTNNRVPSPRPLPKIPGSKIVELIGGSWSMNALDTQGRLHVLGALDDAFPSESDNAEGFLVPTAWVDTFHQILLPVKLRTISFGVDSAVALDVENKFMSQVDGYTAALTKSGDVHVWWPSGIRLHSYNVMFDRDRLKDADTGAKVVDHDLLGTIKAIQCKPLYLNLEMQQLPPIPPNLPLFHHSSGSRGASTEAIDSNGFSIRLAKVVTMRGSLLGLTNGGHVLIMRNLTSPWNVETGRVRWDYLPIFSETQEILAYWPTTEKPENMLITNIVAGCNGFAVYTDDSPTGQVVLLGTNSTKHSSRPLILPTLQNRRIVSISLGDFHSVALTAGGILLTWGADMRGSLGLGFTKFDDHDDEIVVEEPREVVFADDKQMFCIQATAAGWHTGALVIDLDD